MASAETSPAALIAERHHERPLFGIALTVCSTLFLACSDTLAKYLSASLPAAEIAWMRFLVFVVLMLPLAVGSSSSPLKSVRPGLQVLRGLALVSSSILFISGLRFLPIAEASATAFVAPIFVTGLSIVLLGEVVGMRRWIATAVGLLGVVVLLRPGTAAFNTASILPILSALGWAATLVMTRMIASADRVVTTMTFSAVVGFAALSVAVPFVWVAPSLTDVLIGIGIGVASTTGHWIVVLAYRHADASVLAPFTYSQLVWVTLLGYLAFGEVPDGWTVAGAALIIGSGLYIAHRERVRRLQQVAAEPYPGA